MRTSIQDPTDIRMARDGVLNGNWVDLSSVLQDKNIVCAAVIFPQRWIAGMLNEEIFGSILCSAQTPEGSSSLIDDFAFVLEDKLMGPFDTKSEETGPVKICNHLPSPS